MAAPAAPMKLVGPPPFDDGVCLPSDRSEDWDRVDCWEVPSCIGTPSGPVAGVQLVGPGPDEELVGGIVELLPAAMEREKGKKTVGETS